MPSRKEPPPANTITFLGTAGARFMVTRQLAASGGWWLDAGNTGVLVDPGPGCIVQATKRKLRPEKLSAVILSHRHLDHSGDTNIMVEAMTEGGFNRHGRLFAPADALGNEPVIYSYLRDYLDSVEILQEGKSYTVGDISFTTPLRHIHSVETYGFNFHAGGHRFSYIADTRYFEKLVQTYNGELLIINTLLMEPRDTVDHLAVSDTERIIRELKPKVAILTHYGTRVWQAHPWEIAGKLSQSTGCRVLAARDGMKFALSELDQS
ncbi:MAG: MBL fold metallo-hydrolase [Dehalococcoidales bacterium]|nr:MBL fold metallo-hydrolase [Dehalococcoidales bacterium]